MAGMTETQATEQSRSTQGQTGVVTDPVKSTTDDVTLRLDRLEAFAQHVTERLLGSTGAEEIKALFERNIAAKK